ncbi:hypothetical protein GPECTOR_5000g1265 [Gonium pectorale]|uniref:Uncharacterized protein n=1 Tax=Gonium pectorale TaxID=33097 RepID=A0A150H4H9_GONPE|nr:hypothetical protein GPECTOR_5000g1265 [Gonium pectorale]|eukprot:KXZ57039.1 hypothetical protein GPECTOR_5000g1265 [Gonium pectorale]
MPLAVFVRPESVHLDNLAPDKLFPSGSIPIVPTTSSGLTMSLPEAVDFGDGRGKVTSINMRGTNLPLSDCYVVTDYFAQGLLFGSEPWVVDLTPVPSGNTTPSIKQAAVYVMLSRFRRLSSVKLLRPLYREGLASGAHLGIPTFKVAVDAFEAATTMSPDLICGIPMGISAAPFIANLFLGWYEFEFLAQMHVPALSAPARDVLAAFGYTNR